MAGLFWIDPNGWDTDDSILVLCDFQKGATCVIPSPNETASISLLQGGSQNWLVDAIGGTQVRGIISNDYGNEKKNC